MRARYVLAILEMRTASMHVEEDPDLPGVARIARDARWPRPWVLIVGSIHGDEPSGQRAIAALLGEAREGALPVDYGTVITLHGNPAATEAQTRNSPGGVDLNRLFDFRFEHELNPELWRQEHHRALALRPLLRSVDFGLDVHSASAPTPPFAICMSSNGSLELARQLGVAYVTVGWDGPGLLGDQVVLSELSRRDRPGVAVECGSHADPKTTEVARAVVQRYLTATGVLGPRPEEPVVRPTVLRLRDAIRRPGASFRFERPILGLDRLGAGEVVGSDGNLEVRMRRECYALMPNDQVGVGEDMLYLAGPE